MERSEGGKVWLVGAGPGDPELMTLKAKRLVEEAEVVLFDRLLSPEILGWAPEEAEMIDVGKLPGRHKLSQEEINGLLVEKGREGKFVVRLKGGDPFVLGRGGEEALALAEAGIPFEVVPGVTSAISVPAGAGIPVTHRGVATAFTVVTGHEEPGKDEELDWEALARVGGTIVVLMGVSRLFENVSALLRGGRSPDTPAALIERGWSPEERLVVASLGEIVDKAKEAEVESPAILVVGDVVALSEKLRAPAIAILRPDNRGDESEKIARKMGFKPILAPSIAFLELPLPSDLPERIKRAECVVFTSATGAEIALRDPGVADLLKESVLATIGPRTEEALVERGLSVAVVPESYSSRGLALALAPKFKRVLLLRSARGSPELVEILKEAAVEVDEVHLYDISPSEDPRLDWLIRRGTPEIYAFTSGSTAKNLLARARELGCEEGLRDKLAGTTVAAIGPPTKAELERLGVRVDRVPERFTFEGMLEEIRRRR
ncbi:uroporphyrinogen-III C-methyltransferase [Candidatus Methanocrinis natronophilus]|uniref:uroporphyrinogen-III C-methyltransferase n=1 Tax=Candidatus Methanocrinis natronophilus TaxID=3033396 RepID=A0ABT5X569_9EURY|nr:uroporphyrinogen-III C-methyltransferase [Candidatus Methanocrinis natronophilus]MDF0589838.1 uroporphyrinogen-III C-methyltransferase [Candidatus Methanocrinis natronophilus]